MLPEAIAVQQLQAAVDVAGAAEFAVLDEDGDLPNTPETNATAPSRRSTAVSTLREPGVGGAPEPLFERERELWGMRAPARTAHRRLLLQLAQLRPDASES